MLKKLKWKFDMLIYRLFYWRWAPRLKADPDLAYLFAEFSAPWSKANPSKNRNAVDALLATERERIRAGQVCSDKTHWR